MADAAALLNGITSVDPADGATSADPLVGHDFLGDLSTTALQGARIGVVAGQAPAAATSTVTSDGGTVQAAASALCQAALQTLRDQGATVVENMTLQPAALSTAPATGTVSTLVDEFKRNLNT